MMNKFLVYFLAVIMCAACVAAVRSYYHTSHKTHLGGAGYAYHPGKYVGHGVVYRKPVLHHATPIVYAHKHTKPRVTHYVKPAYHHEVPHYAPVYHSKPVHYLGGHVGHHGVVYKPAAVHGHGLSYVHKGHY